MATVPADQPDAELPFQPLPHSDGSVRHCAVLLQPKAPPGDYRPHLQPNDGLQGVEVSVPGGAAEEPPGHPGGVDRHSVEECKDFLQEQEVRGACRRMLRQAKACIKVGGVVLNTS